MEGQDELAGQNTYRLVQGMSSFLPLTSGGMSWMEAPQGALPQGVYVVEAQQQGDAGGNMGTDIKQELTQDNQTQNTRQQSYQQGVALTPPLAQTFSGPRMVISHMAPMTMPFMMMNAAPGGMMMATDQMAPQTLMLIPSNGMGTMQPVSVGPTYQTLPPSPFELLTTTVNSQPQQVLVQTVADAQGSQGLDNQQPQQQQQQQQHGGSVPQQQQVGWITQEQQVQGGMTGQMMHPRPSGPSGLGPAGGSSGSQNNAAAGMDARVSGGQGMRTSNASMQQTQGGGGSGDQQQQLDHGMGRVGTSVAAVRNRMLQERESEEAREQQQQQLQTQLMGVQLPAPMQLQGGQLQLQGDGQLLPQVLMSPVQQGGQLLMPAVSPDSLASQQALQTLQNLQMMTQQQPQQQDALAAALAFQKGTSGATQVTIMPGRQNLNTNQQQFQLQQNLQQVVQQNLQQNLQQNAARFRGINPAQEAPPMQSFADYERKYGAALKCERGLCANKVSQPCKDHKCSCCKLGRQVANYQRQGWCGPCGKREVVSGLKFVRCGRCKAEMLEETYKAHLKQNVTVLDAAGNKMTGRCRDVPCEIVDTDKGRRCGKCTNMRPLTFYASEDTNCSCNMHTSTRNPGGPPTQIAAAAAAAAAMAAMEQQQQQLQQQQQQQQQQLQQQQLQQQQQQQQPSPPQLQLPSPTQTKHYMEERSKSVPAATVAAAAAVAAAARGAGTNSAKPSQQQLQGLGGDLRLTNEGLAQLVGAAAAANAVSPGRGGDVSKAVLPTHSAVADQAQQLLNQAESVLQETAGALRRLSAAIDASRAVQESQHLMTDQDGSLAWDDQKAERALDAAHKLAVNGNSVKEAGKKVQDLGEQLVAASRAANQVANMVAFNVPTMSLQLWKQNQMRNDKTAVASTWGHTQASAPAGRAVTTGNKVYGNKPVTPAESPTARSAAPDFGNTDPRALLNALVTTGGNTAGVFNVGDNTVYNLQAGNGRGFAAALGMQTGRGAEGGEQITAVNLLRMAQLQQHGQKRALQTQADTDDRPGKVSRHTPTESMTFPALAGPHVMDGKPLLMGMGSDGSDTTLAGQGEVLAAAAEVMLAQANQLRVSRAGGGGSGQADDAGLVSELSLGQGMTITPEQMNGMSLGEISFSDVLMEIPSQSFI